MNIVENISKLKKELDAVIIAHNYQLPEIQDIADYTGDSLELSRLSATLNQKIIVFCGVRFMAETAKILSPNKTVLLPEISAGCAMAQMTEPWKLEEMKNKYPDAKVVTYVNTTAETKAMSDICCTSANAVEVVKSIKSNRIIFVPDRNLASYVQRFTDKEIIPYDGYCYVHDQFTIEDIEKAKSKHPNAVVFLHPESPKEVVDISDFILSTGGMIRQAKEIDKDIIVGTENEMVYRLKKEYPNKNFYPLKENPPAICTNMKKITLDSVLKALKNQQYSINVDKNIAEKAFNAIDAMLKI